MQAIWDREVVDNDRCLDSLVEEQSAMSRDSVGRRHRYDPRGITLDNLRD